MHCTAILCFGPTAIHRKMEPQENHRAIRWVSVTCIVTLLFVMDSCIVDTRSPRQCVTSWSFSGESPDHRSGWLEHAQVFIFIKLKDEEHHKEKHAFLFYTCVSWVSDGFTRYERKGRLLVVFIIIDFFWKDPHRYAFFIYIFYHEIQSHYLFITLGKIQGIII